MDTLPASIKFDLTLHSDPHTSSLHGQWAPCNCSRWACNCARSLRLSARSVGPGSFARVSFAVFSPLLASALALVPLPLPLPLPPFFPPPSASPPPLPLPPLPPFSLGCVVAFFGGLGSRGCEGSTSCGSKSGG